MQDASVDAINTEGLILLVRALAGRCECESGDVRTECTDHPLDRWWVRELLGLQSAA